MGTMARQHRGQTGAERRALERPPQAAQAGAMQDREQAVGERG